MPRLSCLVLVISAALAFTAACASDELASTTDPAYSGTGLAISVSPLELPGVSDACYSFEIATAAGARVVARGGPAGGPAAGLGGDGGPVGLPSPLDLPLCASRFGDGQGAISYVAPCDASASPAPHTVTLWVNSICAQGQGPGCDPLPDFVNPCGPDGCTVEALCVENADVPVTFNLTVMASARQGFFDLAVNFDSVFCSAKLDTCYGATYPDDAIRLLHDSAGQRVHTAVAAISCATGANTDAILHFTDLQITCGPDTFTVSLAGVSAEGNHSAVASPPGPALPIGVYYGTEAFPDISVVYTSVAFPVQPSPCQVTWTVVPSETAIGPQPSAAGGAWSDVAAIVYDATTINPGACDSHALGGGGEVTATYLDEPVPYTACLETDADAFCTAPQPFVMRVRTTHTEPGSSGPAEFTIPTHPLETYDYTVTTSDGQLLEGLTGEVTLSFAAPGDYEVSVWGTFPRIHFSNGGDRLKLLEVLSWGTVAWTSMANAFYGCANATAYPSGGDFSLVTDFTNAWRNNALTTFPSLDLSAGLNFNGAWHGNALTSFPLLDLSAAVTLAGAWRGNALTSFPAIDLPNALNISSAWYLNPLTSFPLIDLSAATNLSFAWYICNLSEFPPIHLPSATNLQNAWTSNSLTSFPDINVSQGQNFASAWMGNSLTSFPHLSMPNATDIRWAWMNNSLESFPPLTLSSVSAGRGAWRDNGPIDDFAVRDLEALENATDTFLGTTLSPTDYSELLIALAATNMNTGVVFHAGNAQYTAAASSARDTLVNGRGWLITDGGQLP